MSDAVHADLRVRSLVVGSFFTNCYIVHLRDGQCILIDPGDDPEEIIPALDDCGGVRGILLTHGHFDHVAAAAEISGATGAPVWAHEGDRPWLDGQWDLWGLRAPRLECEYFTDENGPFGVRVFHTPGHSPGSVCYVFDGVVFCGDTLFASSVGRVDLPGGNEAELMNSLQRLRDLLPQDSVLYPGHGPATTLAAELRSNPWLSGL